MSIFIIKNALLSHHNCILEIAVHMKYNHSVEKLNNFLYFRKYKN